MKSLFTIAIAIMSRDSVARPRILCSIAGIICAILIGLLAPMSEPVTAHDHMPPHLITLEAADNCSPSGCEPNEGSGYEMHCGRTCKLQDPEEAYSCCSTESDFGCMSCQNGH